MSERLAFVVVFSLMAGFVVGLTVLAAKTGAPPVIGRTTPAGVGTIPAGAGQSGRGQSGRGHSGRGHSGRGHSGAGQSRRGQSGAGHAASGHAASGHSAHGHPANGDTGTVVIRSDSSLTAEMIQAGSDTAGARLWQAIGGGRGMAVANKALRLRHTNVRPTSAWDQTAVQGESGKGGGNEGRSCGSNGRGPGDHGGPVMSGSAAVPLEIGRPVVLLPGRSALAEVFSHGLMVSGAATEHMRSRIDGIHQAVGGSKQPFPLTVQPRHRRHVG